MQLRQDSLRRAICTRNGGAGVTGAALRYRLAEEAARSRHREQCSDAHAAGRFTEDGDVAGVAAELSDIIADPFQRRDLIKHPLVAARCNLAAGHLRKTQVSQWSETVVDRHKDDVAAARED